MMNHDLLPEEVSTKDPTVGFLTYMSKTDQKLIEDSWFRYFQNI